MSTENGISSLSVALVLTDLEDVKEITAVFRKLGVIPHFYEDLKSFWNGTIERIPSLAIVDVKKMNEGDLILKNHPTVMNEEMPLLFFYTDKTSPLLISTQEIFHLGTVKKSKNYEGVFKGLLKRINKVLLLEQENQNLKYSVSAKSEEVKRLEIENKTNIKTNDYLNLIKEVCQTIEENSVGNEYLANISKTFAKFDAISAYSIVELSFNGQKIISPLVQSNKYRPIPSMWLGQICKEGIEPFAQNMANQVAIEVLGDLVTPLLIYGVGNNLEKIIYIKACDQLMFDCFEWTILELVLNGIHANSRLQTYKNIGTSKNFNSTFDALSFLDDFLYGGLEDSNKKHSVNDYRLVNIDLKIIKDTLLKDGSQRFYWKKFKDDFVNRVEIQTNADFRMIENGVTDLSFLVKSKNFDHFYEQMREISSKFSMWKYFEKAETVMFTDLKLKVSMVPLSAYAYLKHTSKMSADNIKVSSVNDILWNRENNEI